MVSAGRNRAQRGFALLITVTLLAFLVILLLGLATYTRIETAIAGNTQRQAQARENALLAMNVALGQLQKYAGPDQRVTATAEAFPNKLGTAHYTGVWNTDPAAAGTTPMTWLVSGNEVFKTPGDATTNDPLSNRPDNAPTFTDTNSQPLVSNKTSGVKDDVRALLVPITTAGVPGVSATGPAATIGRYAWWVGDQGVKAPVALPDDSGKIDYPPFVVKDESGHIVATDLRDRIRQQIALGAGAANAQTGAPVFEPRDSNNTPLVANQKISAINQIAFLKNPNATTQLGLSRVLPNFHAWSPNNFAVLANTKLGGLRQDLSIQPDLLGSAFASWTNYSAYMETPSAMARAGQTATVTPADDATIPAIEPAYTGDPLRRRYVMGPAVRSDGVVHGVSPTLSFFGMSFSVRESSTNAPQMEIAARCVIALWNPYTGALVPEPLKVEITGLPDIVVADSGTIPRPGNHLVHLQDVMSGGGPLLFSLPWVTDGGAADLKTWLPGRVYDWAAPENLAPVGSSGIPMVAHSPDAIPTDGGSGIVRDAGVEHHASAPGVTDPLTRECNAPEATTLQIRILRASDDTELAVYHAAFPTFGPTTPLPIAQKYVDFAFICRLPEANELPTGETALWLAAAGRDPRSSNFPATGFISGAKGDDPAAYGGTNITSFAVRDPERLLDRAGNNYSYEQDLPVFELPRAPLLSVGQLQHVQLQDARPFSIGNSWGAANQIGSVPVGELFDRFFFSGLAANITPSTVNGSLLLPNSLLMTLRKSDGTKVTVDDIRALGPTAPTADGEGNVIPGSPGSALSSKFFLQGGAFNLNSTSEAAWAAVLRGVRFPAPQSFTYLDADGTTGTADDSAVQPVQSDDARFFRFSQSAQETYKPASDPSDAALLRKERFRQGMRKLIATEVSALARKIVELITTHHAASGPFRSLEEFLAPGDAGTYSLLEQAIADAGINASIAEFSSQWLTQADIMTALAPVLFPRSDTFVIRAYGEALNPVLSTTAAPVIEGRAWCEAVVQRVPEYFDPSTANGDPAEVAPAALVSALNQAYGRRFKIVSFRWLTRSDI